jgi:DNA helicase-2/ATP-dependent DNA helicase PcrA
LLRQYADRFNLDRNFTIYDQSDRTRLVKQALEAAEIDHVRFTPERIEAAISKAKNQLLGPEKYAERAADFFSQTVARAYPLYEKRLREANALDFDDLLLWPALALKHDSELRADLDARFRFLLIDEYQDTNLAQYAIARGLTVDHPNLCVVGDPDQSVYGWRGSDIRNILEFERDFPSARVIVLERNYRSTKSILRAASHLIAHNRKRRNKQLSTENPVGDAVCLLTFETGQDEADGITRRIRDAVESGNRSYRDFAVFIRINALSRALEASFLRHRVPYQIVKGLAFFERKENRDVLAYLRLLLNPRDDLSFLRIVNEPARGIGKVSLEHLRAYAEPRHLSLLNAANHITQIPAVRGKAQAALRDFASMMIDLRPFTESAPDEVIRQVLDRSGYRSMLAMSSDPDDQERLANIEELITAAKQFTAEDSARTIADFLENVTLASDVDGWDNRQDCVAVMTLHAAKGLEFPVVFMAAVEEGLLPHERSQTNLDELEEERRLAFVGMTRAKEQLFLSHARLREFRGMTRYAIPSMFLGELPQDEIKIVALASESRMETVNAAHHWRSGSSAADSAWTDAGVVPIRNVQQSSATNGGESGYAAGMLVHHDTYGRGRVTEVAGYGGMSRVKVRFSRHGEKTFVAEKAKLVIVHQT